MIKLSQHGGHIDTCLVPTWSCDLWSRWRQPPLYRLPAAGGIEQITEDHTHVGWLRRKGELNEREARYHPRKNVLAQALGAGHQFLKPHIGTLKYHPNDRFVLCSDGLIEGLWDRGIEEIVRADDEKSRETPVAQRLVLSSVDRVW